MRFTTLPEPTPPSAGASSTAPTEPTQPPTTLTAILNPMMGHISTAYTARVSRDLALCSRFDFNMYSYESEWAMGAEWWIRRGLRKNLDEDNRVDGSGLSQLPTSNAVISKLEVQGVVKARISTSSVRTLTSLQSQHHLICWRTPVFDTGCLLDVGRPIRTNSHKPRCQVGFLKQVEAYPCLGFRTGLFQLRLKDTRVWWCPISARSCPVGWRKPDWIQLLCPTW